MSIALNRTGAEMGAFQSYAALQPLFDQRSPLFCRFCLLVLTACLNAAELAAQALGKHCVAAGTQGASPTLEPKALATSFAPMPATTLRGEMQTTFIPYSTPKLPRAHFHVLAPPAA